ncbi:MULTISPECIES: hypothetical protein [Methylobacterium]|uniref:Uncharacterized protein n=2 Tax=Methylobacteriaceae TaxID=119045 RepID=A0ABV2NQE9_9HYPH|nr:MULTISPECIES: hypothetical protein [unclassified Methylobacterium]MBP2494676.1 hypothetical protein [Methylobacterium sp. PvP105]MBP2505453.1 hypothetical protein [Methylobacterium sp. PvP109]
MSANPNRRGLLGLFAAAPIAAAASVQPASVLGRVRMMAAAGRFDALAPAALGRLADGTRGAGLPGIGAALERAHPLDASTPPDLLELVAGIGSEPARIEAQLTAEARAIAAVALVYPPEIAAFRSFGAPMRCRLYAELLTRESVRLAAASEPPPMPPASSGPDA